MTLPSLHRHITAAAGLLAAAGVPSPERDARELAAHALGRDLVLPSDPVPEGFAAVFAELVERRRRREPLQHILGRAPFRYLSLAVEPGVFVPRPETEQVAQVAIDEAARVVAGRGGAVVVDLCCGAGGIALAVATEVPGTAVTAVDLSPAAVALTRRNAAEAGAALTVVEGDATDPGLLPALAGRVDVVVSNPPYIPPDAVPVDPEVRDHDPDLALYGGGEDGLAVPRGVLATAVRLLAPGGLLVMEHAEVQAAALRAAATAAGLVGARTVPDLGGRDRAVAARRRDGEATGVGDSPS